MGDIHLDTFSSFALPVDNPISNSRLENILGAMRLAFKTGAEQGITNYVINGDLFNQRLKVNPSFFNYCIQSVVEMYRGCPDNSTLWITVGNHDSQTRFMKPNSVDILISFSTENHKIIVAQDLVEVHKLEDETALALVSFTEDVESSKKMLSDQLDYVTKNKLKTALFAHLGVTGGVQGRWQHKLSGAYNLADLGWNRKYITSIVLGHFHTRNVMKQKGNKKAWYQGDLTELNFNDVNEDGTGAPRGFDIIDTESGESEFYDLSDKFPKFMIYDLDQDKIDIDELIESMNKNYVKIVVHDKDVYQKLTKAYKEQHKEGTPYANIQLKVKPKQEQELEIGATESDADILGKYMDKFYQDKDLKDLALSYLERAEE